MITHKGEPHRTGYRYDAGVLHRLPPYGADYAARDIYNRIAGAPGAYDRALAIGAVTPPSQCKHPPARLWSWTADDALGRAIIVACCQCGTIMAGADPGPDNERSEA